MWTIIKFDKTKLNILEQELKKKLGEDASIYLPKLFIQKYFKNKLINKEMVLMDDYMFCFHKKFEKPETINQIKFIRGLKYILNGFKESQGDIKAFIKKCKESENAQGYLTQNFFKIYENSTYKFKSGPFAEKIFNIINLQKNKIDILLGNIRTKINKKDYLFTPLQ